MAALADLTFRRHQLVPGEGTAGVSESSADPEIERIGELFRDVFDLAGELAGRISDEHVEERLRALLALRTGVRPSPVRTARSGRH
jgi:hypothetical protein